MWRNKAILNQYKYALSQNNPNLCFYMNPDDVTSIYVLIYNVVGTHNEFEGGEYLVHMKIPENYPFSPPVFRFLTPQGRCNINVAVCIDIGHFHSENYRPSLGLYGFAMSLYSFLLSDVTDGINIINCGVEEKRRLAASSVEYNKTNYADILAHFTKIESD